jgi:hypothetical protein
MNLTLSVWQRIVLLGVLNTTQGDLRSVNKALKLIDILEFTPEELTTLNIRQDNMSVQWDKKAEKTSTIIIPDGSLSTFLKAEVEKKKDWPVNKEVLSLCSQLGITDES